MTEAAPQWVPTDQDIANARVTDFARFVRERTGVPTTDYRSLWQWSVDEPGSFWGALWDYFELGDRPDTVLEAETMPGARRFPGARLNYVDQIIRNARTDRPAIIDVTEDGTVTEISWSELLGRTAAFAARLRSLEVGVGDRVVGYLPNVPEAIIAFLATASIGAIWSACGQDYSAKAALERLGQLEPVVLVTVEGYEFAGKSHDKREDVEVLRAGLPTLKATVFASELNTGDDELETVAVDFADPLWILYSSGTTGKPKGIMHGHGGVVLEHLKAIALQSDIGPDDTFFWFTSPSWMMWNFQVAGLLVGATIVCYAGSPNYPKPDALWDITSRVGATFLGASPGYVLGCIKADAVPCTEHDLSALRTVGITGSSLPPSSSQWLGDNAGVHIQVCSISGGTDVVSAFIGGVRTVPVWAGELSAPYLGVALDAWDESGKPVRGEVGELVITKPMPSMPIGFWNDPDGSRYRSAYFEMFPGVWRHGDWITITDHDSIIVHGRSDSTLNRHGIRMGSADIYQAVERLPEIAEALVIGCEQPDGGYWMPLFVVLADEAELTDELRDRIKKTIRDEVSPRHVPDEIIVAPGVPHTRTGKKLEVPIKKLFGGADAAKVVERSAVDDPALLDWYANLKR